MDSLPIVVLALVFSLIMFRQVGRLRFKIWQIMLGGAIIVLLAGSITPHAAAVAIDLEVMLFLFGMFIVGRALELSGALAVMSEKLFRNAKTADHLLLLLLFGAGLSSAVLMNDTLAIVGTPIVIFLSRRHGIGAKPLLLALAFAVTIGSALSPIGNPQNLLVATKGGLVDPFGFFLRTLLLPTIINLLVAYVFLKVFFRSALPRAPLEHHRTQLRDPRLGHISTVGVIIILALIAAKVVLALTDSLVELPLPTIALAAGILVLLLSHRSFELLRTIDWETLIFFAAMFVLMASVWQTGFFQTGFEMIKGRVDLTGLPMIFVIGILLSQLISNVPLVALYLPLLLSWGAGPSALVALGAASTIAGNLFILGAASNIIIIQNAEKHGETITFWEFAKVGVPLTIANALVYWLFLAF